MLKRMDTSSRFRIIRKATPNIWIPSIEVLRIPSFVLQKRSFDALLEERIITLLSLTGQKKIIKIVRTLIVVKF